MMNETVEKYIETCQRKVSAAFIQQNLSVYFLDVLEAVAQMVGALSNSSDTVRESHWFEWTQVGCEAGTQLGGVFCEIYFEKR